MYDSYDPEMELMELEAGDSMFGAYQEGAFETGGGLGGFEAMFEDEFESFGEFENDGYFEFESDFGELEGDPFFGKIWNGVKKVAKAVAPLAKKFAPQKKHHIRALFQSVFRCLDNSAYAKSPQKARKYRLMHWFDALFGTQD